MSCGEIPHLETFCKAAELLNFTAAAEALSLTQAAVSQRIKALEEDVGVPLFERHAGRVSLTPRGRTLHQYARRILTLADEARAALGQPPAEVAGDLHLAASTVPAEHLLPDLLQEFQRRYPAVHVTATVGDSTAALESLEAGKAHLALVGQVGAGSWCESKPFARDHLVLALPPGHRWSAKSRIRFDDLVREPLILREIGSGSRACFEEALHARGKSLKDLHVTLELGSNEAIKEAVLHGAGAAILSAFALKHDLESGRLNAAPLADLDATRDLYVVTDKRRVLPPPARAFLEVIEASPFANA